MSGRDPSKRYPSGLFKPATPSQYLAWRRRSGERGLGRWVSAAASAVAGDLGRAQRAIRASRLPPSLYDATRARLRSHLGGARRTPGIAVRTLGRGGGDPIPHPFLTGFSAPQYHIIHDRVGSTLQVIGEGPGDTHLHSHQATLKPDSVRPATGTGNPNMDIPIIHNLESAAKHVFGVFEDIGHIFEGK